jgi:hypothetical protein
MKTIKQTITFNAPPNDIYDYIINGRKLTKITGGKATNTEKVGGKFTAWDDYIFGKNIELVPGKRLFKNGLVQIFQKAI